MPINERDDSGLEELGTPADIRAPHEPAPVTEPASPQIADPHGATDAITSKEYVGRRGGVRGLVDSVAYWVQLVPLSIYGPAPQAADADPVVRLKRKYGRDSRPA